MEGWAEEGTGGGRTGDGRMGGGMKAYLVIVVKLLGESSLSCDKVTIFMMLVAT